VEHSAGVLLDEIDRARAGGDDIVEEFESEFSGELDARRIDEALGIDPEIFDTVKERLEELKEEVRAGRNPSQLLQKWLLRRKQ
jgi:hypothetical protein